MRAIFIINDNYIFNKKLITFKYLYNEYIRRAFWACWFLRFILYKRFFKYIKLKIDKDILRF